MRRRRNPHRRSYKGAWDWNLLSEPDSRNALDFLCEMAALTWDEVRAQVADGPKRHHYHPVEMICSAAKGSACPT